MPLLVWLLETGEDHAGGRVLGIYTEPGLASGDFLDRAREIGAIFGIDSAEPGPDGSLRAHGGCDWLTLRPYPLTTRPALPSGTGTGPASAAGPTSPGGPAPAATSCETRP